MTCILAQEKCLGKKKKARKSKKDGNNIKKYKYCTFLNGEYEYKGTSSNISEKTARKVDAMKQYFHQYYRDLFYYKYHRELRFVLL